MQFSKPNTERNRREAIVSFLARAREKLTPYNVFVSADNSGYVCWNLDDTGIGQCFRDLGTVVDYISPCCIPRRFNLGFPEFPILYATRIVSSSRSCSTPKSGRVFLPLRSAPGCRLLTIMPSTNENSAGPNSSNRSKRHRMPAPMAGCYGIRRTDTRLMCSRTWRTSFGGQTMLSRRPAKNSMRGRVRGPDVFESLTSGSGSTFTYHPEPQGAARPRHRLYCSWPAATATRKASCIPASLRP